MMEVKVNGKAFPCRPTMGAMLRFKKETGKEITQITGENFTDLCIYLYCCVASACKADNIQFDMELMDFADALSQEDMLGWTEQMQNATAQANEQKKR